ASPRNSELIATRSSRHSATPRRRSRVSGKERSFELRGFGPGSATDALDQQDQGPEKQYGAGDKPVKRAKSTNDLGMRRGAIVLVISPFRELVVAGGVSP